MSIYWATIDIVFYEYTLFCARKKFATSVYVVALNVKAAVAIPSTAVELCATHPP